MEKVEYDFQVTEETYREPLELELILNKHYFYGKSGLNINLEKNIFMLKEEANELANCIHSLHTRKMLGEEINPLEKLALQLLAGSYT